MRGMESIKRGRMPRVGVLWTQAQVYQTIEIGIFQENWIVSPISLTLWRSCPSQPQTFMLYFRGRTSAMLVAIISPEGKYAKDIHYIHCPACISLMWAPTLPIPIPCDVLRRDRNERLLIQGPSTSQAHNQLDVQSMNTGSSVVPMQPETPSNMKYFRLLKDAIRGN
jgi:hypothetical protein